MIMPSFEGFGKYNMVKVTPEMKLSDSGEEPVQQWNVEIGRRCQGDPIPDRWKTIRTFDDEAAARSFADKLYPRNAA